MSAAPTSARERLRILLAPIGTAGDVHPFVALGRGLARRGHRVTVLVQEPFLPLIEGAGLDGAVVGPPGAYERCVGDPRLWDSWSCFEALAEHLLPVARPLHDAIVERFERGRTVVAAPGLSFGARLAQEGHGVPLVTVHLQPYCLRSLGLAPALLPSLAFRRPLPRFVARALRAIAEWRAEAIFAPHLNAVRGALGLPPVHRPFVRWWHSPLRVIGLFPPWFAPPQPDWPPQVRLTSFLVWDGDDEPSLTPDAETFLADAEPPIAFVAGSGMRRVAPFFAAGVEASARLGRRALLLTPHREQLPSDLPPGVRSFPYLPLSRLAPRCAALVHHGGIGSVARGLAAGIPQLVCPRAFDQPDNGVRLRRLGVGDSLGARRWKAARVAAALDRLLASAGAAERCAAVARRMAGEPALDASCRLIEEVAKAW